jgi:hypothetical protein
MEITDKRRRNQVQSTIIFVELYLKEVLLGAAHRNIIKKLI